MNPSSAPPGSTALQAWVRALECTAASLRDPARSLPLVLDEAAQRHPQAPALLSDEGCLTHGELAARLRRYARWAQRQGLARGRAVALVMENCPEYLALWLGLTRAGLVVSLINTQLRGDGLRHAVRLVDPAQVLVGASLWPQLGEFLAATLPGTPVRECGATGQAGPSAFDREVEACSDAPLTAQECPPPLATDWALHIYTSGTTGLPKAARVSHARVLQWSHWFAGMMQTTAADRMYNCLPMYHSVGGIVAVGSTLVHGGSVVLRRRFSASRFWDDLQRWDCTLFQYIGELCRILLREAGDGAPPPHRIRIACGNGLAADVWQRFQERFAIPQILEFYAATEANFSLYNYEGRPGALGRVPRFFAHRFAVRLVRFDVAAGQPERDAAGRCVACAPGEVGEAVSQIRAGAGRGDGAGRAFEGYTDDGATSAKVLRDVFEAGDAWYRSGDLMRQDAEGFFYFVDRIGDTFRWKGENVSTTQVAGALCACPGVDEALVYGVAVPGHDGRAGMAALSTSEGFDPARLWQHAEESLPRYARPLFLRLLQQVERTSTFKPTKQELQRVAFDPAQCPDPLYVRDAAAQAYVPLTPDLWQRLHAASFSGF